ncbi:MAG: sodium:solute symporter family protein [Sulfuricella sp.]|nr:sodium:solute symporter family protein [Sulfuricella sp.]
MLIWFVVLYLLLSIGIGLVAATRVHSAKDFAVAGRHLPLPVVTATVFATWFGAETVLGISATFTKEGLRGVVADPFGSSLCLILAGVFFASKLYRMNLLTIGDYYRLRYNRVVEVIVTLCIVASYLGWVSAQIKALGLVFNVVTDGAIDQQWGMILGAAIVLTYTTFGGMLSVAILDFVQMTVIMGGMLYIGYLISGMTGGVGAVVSHASQAGKLDFFPAANAAEWIPFIGAWVTMMFGSIPQQDVFQRITSAKDEKTAITGSVLGGSIYFLFAFVPMFLAYSATLIDPAMFGELLDKDPQLVLPTLILQHTPVFAQVVFFGALLSAIMSCSSATLLAPSVAFSENIVRNFFPNLGDHAFLRVMRGVILCFAVVVLGFALNSGASIFKMVENAYKITLVAAFIPLFAGLYWKRANIQGAYFAIAAGLVSWVLLEVLQPDTVWPAQLVGLLMSGAGMVAGSLLPHWVGRPTLAGPAHAALHHHAAAQTSHVSEAPHHHPPTHGGI